MKFRQKIWALPLASCLVFGLGLSASLWIATTSQATLKQLHGGHIQVLETTVQLDRLSEQFDSALEAAGFGDAKKLGEAGRHAEAIRQRLAALTERAAGDPASAAMAAAFGNYHAKAMGIVQGMNNGGDVTPLLLERRTAQTAWQDARRTALEQARQAVGDGFSQLDAALRNTVLTSALTAIAVLLVLGLASWRIVRSVWRELGDEPAELRRMVRQVADGQLDLATGPSLDGSLHHAMGAMVQRLREMVTVIRESAEGIGTAASEIATGNQDLSGRTERAASSLQETSSSVQQLARVAGDSGESATTATRLAGSARDAASQGSTVVAQVVAGMQQIDQSARQITDIIAVIDSIAFQTNILALNAAVEAARAGEDGRGFAVVAAEVRMLARRSAEAASQIKTLIEASTERVRSGSALASEAGAAMQRILASVHEVGDTIAGIQRAAERQTDEIGGLSQVIVQLDGMTQQNAALVEQSAAASMSLREQTQRLAGTVAVFRLGAAEAASVAG